MDSKEYRKKLGFTNKDSLKSYFKASDIKVPNWKRINKCNQRLREIFLNLNKVVSDDIKSKDIVKFCKKIDLAFSIMKENKLIEGLNNQGRKPDDVYYNWMRGYLVCEYFLPSIAKILNLSKKDIHYIGKDDLKNIKTFTRAATADIEILHNGKKIRLEIQAGYTGVNDIKQSKILEAKKCLENNQIESYIVHFDLFNGRAAIINISNFYKQIPAKKYRKAFENINVLTVSEDWFKWDLTSKLLSLEDYLIMLD